MRNIIIMFMIGKTFGGDVEFETTELTPLIYALPDSAAPLPSDLAPDDLDEQRIAEESSQDLQYLQNEGGMSEVSELIEEIFRYRKFLSTHRTDFNTAIESGNYTSVFLSTFSEIRTLSGLESLQKYFAQVYYDMQIKALYDRLDRGRSTLYKTLAANNYRTSATQESINSLNVYAALLNLNIQSDPGYLGMVMQYFSQSKPADLYFSEIFSKMTDRDQQNDLMDIALTYLIERYRVDRSWFNKILHYCGIKHSYTREAILTLQNIATLLNIRTRDDYQRLMAAADQKMLEDALEYLLTLAYS
ncbi:MAG: hypothetical protein KF798_03225 [Candidatus Paracaedibacteraceae bacterium]|nr:hypothetical protein [Candidatus Paracaedibacteraceae bacterium]